MLGTIDDMHSNKYWDEIADAAASAEVIRLWRESLDGPGGSIRGYVVAHGDDLACILQIDHHIAFDGFAIVRIGDISAVEAPCSQADFIERALRLRNESVEEAPAVRLSSMAAAVESLSALVPIFAVHREIVAPDACLIGRPVRLEAERMLLLEIDANARWAEQPTEVDYGEITRLDFGGAYEQALMLVADAGE